MRSEPGKCSSGACLLHGTADLPASALRMTISRCGGRRAMSRILRRSFASHSSSRHATAGDGRLSRRRQRRASRRLRRPRGCSLCPRVVDVAAWLRQAVSRHSWRRVPRLGGFPRRRARLNQRRCHDSKPHRWCLCQRRALVGGAFGNVGRLLNRHEFVHRNASRSLKPSPDPALTRSPRRSRPFVT